MSRPILISSAVLSTALGLIACDQHVAAPDGYSFERKEFVRGAPNISIVVHRSLDELRHAAPRAAEQPVGRELMAWSIIRPGGCEVHVVDPTKSYGPQWLGHEVAHCVWGRWHV